MKVFKKIFPSRNYITIDAFGDCEIIFNPVGDGFEGEDSLKFRRGRWAFRVNDFLAGKVLPNGEKEGMNRKTYSIGIVYDDADGEPIISTTYVDPTSVIPLDGSMVTINGFDGVEVTNDSLSVDVKNDLLNVRVADEVRIANEIQTAPVLFDDTVYQGQAIGEALGCEGMLPQFSNLPRTLGGCIAVSGGTAITDVWECSGHINGTLQSGLAWTDCSFALVGKHSTIVAKNIDIKNNKTALNVAICQSGVNPTNAVITHFWGAKVKRLND